jgi:hypothetical protein
VYLRFGDDDGAGSRLGLGDLCRFLVNSIDSVVPFCVTIVVSVTSPASTETAVDMIVCVDESCCLSTHTQLFLLPFAVV